MAKPSSQAIAAWVKDEIQATEWVSLEQVCVAAVQRRLSGASETYIADLVSENLQFVAEHLRDETGEWNLDGTIPLFEIDSEVKPYIRLLGDPQRPLLEKLRRIDPFKFEEVCSDLLSCLGATSFATKASNDGGVDFVGYSFKIVPAALSVPAACKAAVIGQAKRYKDGRLISQTRLREFVGAATLRKHELQRDQKIGALSPVLYAFWTTSDFEPNAKTFARELGLWHMDGRTLATYGSSLGLLDKLMALPDAETP